MELKGATALVTGAASGIGAATARRLAAEGARVVVGDIDRDGAEDLAAELDGIAVLLDVTDRQSVVNAIASAERAAGPVEVLVNNAGGGRLAYFIDTDPASWDAIVHLNLMSVLACTHAVLPGMYRRRAGTIINVASEAALSGTVGGATYAAAKAGVIGFTRAIAREAAGYGVRCNAVAPGPVDTPLLNDSAAAAGAFGHRVRQAMIDATTMGRAGRPEEIADAIIFLAGDGASYITGQTVAVSGGLSMR